MFNSCYLEAATSLYLNNSYEFYTLRWSSVYGRCLEGPPYPTWRLRRQTKVATRRYQTYQGSRWVHLIKLRNEWWMNCSPLSWTLGRSAQSASPHSVAHRWDDLLPSLMSSYRHLQEHLDVNAEPPWDPDPDGLICWIPQGRKADEY